MRRKGVCVHISVCPVRVYVWCIRVSFLCIWTHPCVFLFLLNPLDYQCEGRPSYNPLCEINKIHIDLLFNTRVWWMRALDVRVESAGPRHWFYSNDNGRPTNQSARCKRENSRRTNGSALYILEEDTLPQSFVAVENTNLASFFSSYFLIWEKNLERRPIHKCNMEIVICYFELLFGIK